MFSQRVSDETLGSMDGFMSVLKIITLSMEGILNSYHFFKISSEQMLLI